MATTFSDVVDQVQRLDSESKHELLELIRRWLVDEGREEILQNARVAESAHARGEAKSGGVDDLLADLDGED